MNPIKNDKLLLLCEFCEKNEIMNNDLLKLFAAVCERNGETEGKEVLENFVTGRKIIIEWKVEKEEDDIDIEDLAKALNKKAVSLPYDLRNHTPMEFYRALAKEVIEFQKHTPDYHVIKKTDVDEDVMRALENIEQTLILCHIYDDDEYEWLQVIKNALIAQSDPNTDQGWMPIETAPKDGTEIEIGVFLYWSEEAKEKKEPRIGNGFYAAGAYWWERSHWSNRIAKFIKNPTHWRPLPEPPTE